MLGFCRFVNAAQVGSSVDQASDRERDHVVDPTDTSDSGIAVQRVIARCRSSHGASTAAPVIPRNSTRRSASMACFRSGPLVFLRKFLHIIQYLAFGCRHW